ncbi:MAG: type II toxin-antitoxin system VapC family toxin [Pirellulaceae bacterium]|nr:type II toxin-antitoxin system VapC family toxin [Pirellulaceae bacterium]
MDAYSFDASALIKRYVNEAGSTWVQSLFDLPGRRNYIARIGSVEVVAALTRLAKGGYISSGDASINIAAFRHDLATQYVAVPVNRQTISFAMDLAETHTLRGYDAVQLACALAANARRQAMGGSALTLISADIELNAAATMEGLAVDDPNRHP